MKNEPVARVAMGDPAPPLKRATSEDLNRLYAVLLDRSARLRRCGNHQWFPPYPLERFAADIDQGKVWWCEDNDGLLGTVMLTERMPDYHPPTTWPPNRRAWYIMRLAVPTARGGEGAGRRILRAIEDEATRAGVKCLRLDCLATTPALTTYYREAGFELIGAGVISGKPASFLQRWLNDAQPARSGG